MMPLRRMGILNIMIIILVSGMVSSHGHDNEGSIIRCRTCGKTIAYTR